MRTALDTNIVSALWSNEATAASIAQALGEVRSDGAVILSGVVYCELLAHPSATEKLVNEFCADGGIEIDFRLHEAAWVEAGRRFAKYSNRRRSSGDGGPKRLLADFLVGAHALIQADRLMTMDKRRYQQDFPELPLYKLHQSALP